MSRLLINCRIALGLIVLTLFVVAGCLGSNRFYLRDDLNHARQSAICESTALALSYATRSGDRRQLQQLIDTAVDHYEELVAVQLKTPHVADVFSGTQSESETNGNMFSVPLNRGPDEVWGTLDFEFAADTDNSIVARYPIAVFLASTGAVLFPLFVWFSHRLTSQLASVTNSAPTRLHSILNTLPGGMVVLSDRGRVLLANTAFADLVGVPTHELPGRSIGSFGWDEPIAASKGPFVACYPWQRSKHEMEAIAGGDIVSRTINGEKRTFLVKAAPVATLYDGEHGGVLLSIDDITQLQKKNLNLNRMLGELESTRALFKKHNEELRVFETRDGLTRLLNRRAFIEVFETHFETAKRYGRNLGLLLIDVDHFKEINDTYGHAVGDRVLQCIAAELEEKVRAADARCRYGGEEFVVLMPHQDMSGSQELAERIRTSVTALNIDGLKISVSIGVTAISCNPSDLHGMIEQASEAVRAAKQAGRNRVVAWTPFAGREGVQQTLCKEVKSERPSHTHGAVSFHAAQAMYSMLLLRSRETAEHCRRVADLCAIAGSTLLPPQEVYTLEVAAMLHEIGKIGLPDEMLRHTGPKSTEEQKIIEFYIRLGRDLVQATFNNESLNQALERPSTEFGAQDNLASHLLLLADEFDRLTFDREGERHASNEAAFEELRRLRLSRVAPALIEHFILSIKERDVARNEATVGDGANQSLLEFQDKVLRELCIVRDQMREREIISESTLNMVRHL